MKDKLEDQNSYNKDKLEDQNSYNNDKLEEQNRYNNSSINKIKEYKYNPDLLKIVGSDSFPSYLQSPYIYFENFLIQHTDFNTVHLDLCCGDGIHSFTCAKNGAKTFAVDYSENSIEIAKLRSKSLNINTDFIVCDSENLPFQDNHFDLITIVGSLSYLDLDKVILEIKRVLKTNGMLICLDSYNHNFFYRFNRNIRYILGNRSYSTLKRMPNSYTINKFKEYFKILNIEFFGTLIFLVPLMRLFFSDHLIKKFIDLFDKKYKIFNKYAFKIVFILKKI